MVTLMISPRLLLSTSPSNTASAVRTLGKDLRSRLPFPPPKHRHIPPGTNIFSLDKAEPMPAPGDPDLSPNDGTTRQTHTASSPTTPHQTGKIADQA